MTGQIQPLARWVVFTITFLALLVGGSAASWLVFDSATQDRIHAEKQSLLQTAQLAAQQIEFENLEQFQTPTDDSGKVYSSQQSKLTSLLKSAPGVEHLYTLREKSGVYYFLNTVSASSEKNRKGRLLDPLSDVPQGAIEAYSGTLDVSATEEHTDRWGTWLSAYSPIKNEAGEVVAVLGVDQSLEKLLALRAPMAQSLQKALAIVVIVSMAIAWVLSGMVGRAARAERSFWNRNAWRMHAAQALLVFIGLGVGVDAALDQSRHTKLESHHYDLVQSSEALDHLNQFLSAANSGQAFDAAQIKSLKKALDSADLGRLGDLVDQAQTMENGAKASEELAAETATLAEGHRKALESVSQEVEDTTAYSWRLPAVTLLVAFISVLLIRHTGDQNRRLELITKQHTETESRYASVIQHLPVGLFVIENGLCSFGNDEWYRQIGLSPAATQSQGITDQDRSRALIDAIHPEDRDEVARLFAQASAEAKPFQVQYRLQAKDSSIRHMESRGVPVYNQAGVCESILAFTLDVTATIQARLAMQSAYDEVEHKNKLLSDALSELERNLESVVRALVKAVEAKDPYTAGHSERVMQYSVWLGQAIGLGPYELRILELGTLVHDVGKIGIPDAILTKPDRLTDEEFEIIRRHPVYGVNIIGNIGLFKECLPIVRWHHERLDGRGYPDGLKADEIPLLVRISAIADIFDAMTSTRAYRSGLALETVLETMNGVAERGEIDAHLFAVFCQVIHERGIIPQTVVQEPWKAA
ncbi:MAG: HD domain-containing protein [Armatimonadetes bacterium]|nr:HD domain-containing protein [Armatimonadota bacterium]